jgi:hypothetical protein
VARKTADGDEAAAVAAAIARFEAEVGGSVEEAPPAVNPWQRAALIEGVGAKQTVQDLERGSKWLS